MFNPSIQFSAKQNALIHLLTIEGLAKQHLLEIFHKAEAIASSQQSFSTSLASSIVVNLFFENSTRTRTTFEIAAKRLGAALVNFDVKTSSTSKGETFHDTLANIEAMGAHIFVLRHSSPGAAHFAVRNLPSTKVSVINAGDGNHSHPTQALLDIYTLWKRGLDFTTARIAIVGDILHSRVARSLIHGLHIMGCRDIRLVQPLTLASEELCEIPGVSLHTSIETGLKNASVVIALRLQEERMHAGLIPSRREYFMCYGITKKLLQAYAAEGVVILHPGPINRGVEIDSEVADSRDSLILSQVENGIAIRMAVMGILRGNIMNYEL